MGRRASEDETHSSRDGARPEYPERVEIVVEIPRGSRNKYEASEDGTIWFDRRLGGPAGFPGDYGYIIGAEGEDGDALDALVLIGSFALLCLLGMPVAYALGLSAIVAAVWLDFPLEAIARASGLRSRRQSWCRSAGSSRAGAATSTRCWLRCARSSGCRPCCS